MPNARTIEIDLDKKCTACGKPGACQNGLCLMCTSKSLLEKMRKARANESPKS
jgi:hypothetical protein